MNTAEQNELILSSLKASKRARTSDQLVKKCHLSKACVWRTLKRLEAQGLVCKVGEYKSIGNSGFVAATWKVVAQDVDRTIHRRISAHKAPTSPKRDPLVAAFFGEYQREAA